jgi:hypothetical protein
MAEIAKAMAEDMREFNAARADAISETHRLLDVIAELKRENKELLRAATALNQMLDENGTVITGPAGFSLKDWLIVVANLRVAIAKAKGGKE